MPFTLQRAPQTDDELWWVIKAMWGIELPRVKVCADHVSPFDAVAHAYFGREPNFAVWYASRGSGKSLALAVLGLTKAFVRDVDVTILGGSMTQSLNVREHMRKLMAHKNAPVYAVEKDQATLIQMHSGKAIKPLPASQTTVRGPHPPLQLLDEVDEMELSIYNASLGQAMEQKNTHGETVEEYIVASSTWQNPEGTFTTVMEDAREKKLPVFTWCWRELLEPHGWMTKRFIESKRKAVSAQMWHTEYELNEPSAGSRAVDLDKVEEYFEDPSIYGATISETHKGNGDHDEYVWEEPVPGAVYAIGVDWAKEQDKTIVAVLRYDQRPHRMVMMVRINRRPWDYIIGRANAMKAKYRAVMVHDKTGLGSVVNDYLDETDTVSGFVMVGRPRTKLLLDYITAFEHGRYRLPRIPANEKHAGVTTDPIYRAHRATTVADVYAPGKWDGHLPDEMAAMALAHHAIEKMPQPATEESGVPLDTTPRAVDAPFQTKHVEETVMVGDVRVVSKPDESAMELIVAGDGGRDIWDAMSF